MKNNEVRIAYKSRIKITKSQKEKNDNIFFILNQVYNFSIEKLTDKKYQKELVALECGEYIPYNNTKKFVITKKSKIRNHLLKQFKKYAEDRKLKIKGLSKPIQLKVENFLHSFNKIYLSPNKEHNFKITSPLRYGSFTTDSSIKLRKVKYKKKTKYFVKIGTEEYQFKNHKLNIKHFTLKTVTLSRKNGKYYISLSGIKRQKKQSIYKISGLDVNFEEMVLSNGFVFKTKNMENKLNLYTKKLETLKQRSSKIQELNKEVLKTLCSADGISMYNGKRFTKEAKKLYKDILSKDKEYRKLQKQINNLYEKRTNIQKDIYNKISHKIAKITDLCFIEDLNIDGMVEGGKVRNDNLYNASLSKFLTILSNKMLTSGKIAIKVNPKNTSKKCSTIGCDYIYENMDLSIREWYCDRCDTVHNRDLNSSWNIIYQGVYDFVKTQGDEYKFSIQLDSQLKSVEV